MKKNRQERLKEIQEYIDTHYIPDLNDDIVMDQEMQGFFDDITAYREKREIEKQSSRMDDATLDLEEAPLEFDASNYTKKKLINPLHEANVVNRKLEDLIDQMDETFSQRLFRMIDEREMVESDVYKRAYVDRRHFSKIKKDIYYSPNKKTVFAFAIALELSIDETKDLLGCAGYALSRSSKFDIIVAYFLQNKIYDMFEINDVLYAYEQPIFE